MARQWSRVGAVISLAIAFGVGRDGFASASDLSTAPAEGATIEVPADFGTIQEAVDAAAPGDLILVSPGTYHEAVNVQTDAITIRGLDRNDVILDGALELDNGIRVLGANGVVIENMTAINYTSNGFFWTGVDGYRGSYLTASRIGLYGLYSFDSINGQFDHSYAAGTGGAGFYVGQCYPCGAVVDHVVAEHNGIGFFGTNAGGDLFVINSRFNNNRVGTLSNSGSYELCYPQREITIAGNLVYSNNQSTTAAFDMTLLAMGNGVYIAGGIGDVVMNNRVWDHTRTGVALVPYIEETPLDDQPAEDEWDRTCAEAKQDPVNEQPPDSQLWDPKNNAVTGNVVEDSGVADLAVATMGSDLATLGNCFAGNEFAISAPEDVEALAPCSGDGAGEWSAGQIDLVTWIAEAETAGTPPAFDVAEFPEPAPQENMLDAATTPANPATDLRIDVDVDAIEVPDMPADSPQDGPPPTPTVGPNGSEVSVQSIDNTFRPDRIEVAAGTEVVWTNFGRTEHDILAVDGSWGVEPADFQPGDTFSHVFGEVGEFPYYCSIHADVDLPQFGMVGTIVVVAA